MKLQRLTIHNIASVKDAVIDFDQAPLADSDVFLITGKTGSGKSTILDAICLALYSSTPRLKNTNMQGDVSDGDKTVKINDPRQLMRRNTGEAFVELTFTGNNGIPYMSRWSVARANKKPNGNLQAKKWALTDLRRGFTLSKDDEIREEIAKAVGLDFSQFCRTTLLAQGEFTRFLNSKDDDKAAILEKITGVSAYSEIGRKVFELTNRKRKAWEDMEEKFSDMPVLPDDDRKRITEELSAATTEYEMLGERRNLLSKAHGHLSSIESYGHEMKTLLKDSSELHDRFAGMLAGVDERADAISDLQEEYAKTEAMIVSEKPRAHALSEHKAILAGLRVIYDAEKKIAEENGRIQKDQEAYEGNLRKAYYDAQRISNEAHKMFELRKQELDDLELELSKSGIGSLRAEKEKILSFLNLMISVEVRKKTLDAERDRYARSLAALRVQEEKISVLKKEADGMEPAIAVALARKEMSAGMLEKQRGSIDSWAKSVRAKLQNGDICPVCGQKIVSKALDENALDELFREAEAAFHEAEEHLAGLIRKRDSINAQAAAFAMQYQIAFKAHESDKTLEEAEKAFADACIKCNIDPQSQDIVPTMAAYREKAEKEIAGLNERIKAAEIAENGCRAARKAIEACLTDLRKADEAADMAKRIWNECASRIETGKSLVTARRNDIAAAEASITGLIVSDQWNNDWKTDIVAFGRELKVAAEVYESLLEKKRALRVSIDSASAEVNQIRTVLNQMIRMDAGLAEVHPAEAYDSSVPLAEAANDLLAAVRSLHDRRKLTKEKLDAEIRQLTSMMNDNPGLSEHNTPADMKMLIEETDGLLMILGEKKGSLQQTLRQDEENRLKKGRFAEESGKLKNEYLKWSRLNMLIGDATGKKFRQIAQSYILSSLISSANHYMSTLTDRYTLKVIPGTFVIMIVDAYQGYTSRAASTISGGESFLVSLSLALALSDIGQQLAVDILFIDEGFGTLSGEPLHNAVATLRTLHRKAGRRVGIISHVEELREKIPVQIRVNQEGKDSSGKIEIS